MAFDAKEFVVAGLAPVGLLVRPFTGEVIRLIQPIDYSKPTPPNLAMRCFVEPGVKGCASERASWMFSGVALTDVICDRLDELAWLDTAEGNPFLVDSDDEEPFA